MQVFTATLNQMLVLFIFMALGFFLNKKRLLPLDDSVVLSKLETYAFVPCLVFSVFYKYCTVGNFKQKWTYMLYGAAVMAVSLPIGIVLAKFFAKDGYLKKIYTYSFAVANFSFMGNAVVLGDYLLARNMELGMRSGQYDLVSYVIASIATLCEGELLQSDRAERMEITRDAYLEIIYKKTASLLGISAGVGALSAGANREQVARMRRFGDALGMAFQIQDDILDFTRGAETGKPSNNDLREHKITLPLLLLLDRADAARRDELLALLARCREDEAAVDALQQAVEEQGGLQEASKVMQSYLQRATALLAEWPDGPIRSALVNLCAYVAERNR